MKPEVRVLLDNALRQARTCVEGRDWDGAWRSLERAHILSQAYAIPHAHVHWQMLRLSLAQHDGREALGQVLRLALAVPGSLTGKAPLGNIGRATVSAFTPMPLPEDLKDVLS